MNHPVRRRFWLQTALAAATFVLLIVTLISSEWIEEVFGLDPDNGSGALEWVIVAVLALATIACALAARREWRRPAY